MRRSAAMALALTLLILSGCAGSPAAPTSGSPVAVAPAATATATATPAPTPTATPAPTPTATVEPSSSPDPSADLEIAAPYGLQILDPISQAAYEGAMSQALGSLGTAVQIGIRQVTKGAAPSGFVMVIEFTDPNISQMTGFLDAVAGGSAASMGGKIAKKTILGAQVRYASSPQGAFAAYRQGDAIVYVLLPTAKSSLDVITALIKANR